MYLNSLEALNSMIKIMVHPKMKLTAHAYTNNEDIYWVLSYKSKSAYPDTVTNTDKLLSVAYSLLKPQYTKISTLCVDLLNETVWVDKISPVIVHAIINTPSGPAINTANNKTHLIDTLYLKK